MNTKNIEIVTIPLFHKIISDPKLIEKVEPFFFDKGTAVYVIYELIKKNPSSWNNLTGLQVKSLVKENNLQISDDIVDNIMNSNELEKVDTTWLEEKFRTRLLYREIENKLLSGITDFKLLNDNLTYENLEKFNNKLKKSITKEVVLSENKWDSLLSPILPDDATPLKCGYKFFDDWQIIRKKRTTCYIGKTNSGKTYSLINLAASLTRNGYKVAYLSFEVERQDIRIRILSQLFNLPQDKVKTLYDPKEIQKLWEINCQGLRFPEVFSDSYNTYDHSKLVNEILEKENEGNFKFDAIIIDYMSLLDSNEEQMYLKGKDISQAFARYSKSYDWAIITAAQVNRPGLTKIRLGMDDIAESAAMLHTFDFIVSIIHSEHLRTNNNIAWELIKARYVNDSNRPGVITSFNINWNNGGKYNECLSDKNEEIISMINEDNDNSTKKKTTTKKKDTSLSSKKVKTLTIDQVVNLTDDMMNPIKNSNLF
jgi:KaiC/GvpD/RAD55 family RecA-like ATPase